MKTQLNGHTREKAPSVTQDAFSIDEAGYIVLRHTTTWGHATRTCDVLARYSAVAEQMGVDPSEIEVTIAAVGRGSS